MPRYNHQSRITTWDRLHDTVHPIMEKGEFARPRMGVVRRSDGFLFVVYIDRCGRRLLRAGCRTFTYREARRHWGVRHHRNYRGRIDCLNRESNLILDLFRLQGLI
jgi:hypothetical protein